MKTGSLADLVFLRVAVGSFMEAGGDITQIGALERSRFSHLEDCDTLKGRNARQAFQKMDWE